MLISFNFEFNHILIIIASIVGVIHNYTDEKYFSKKEYKDKIHQCFLATIGQSITIILYFIEQCFSPNKIIFSNERKTVFSIDYEEIEKLKRRNKKNKIKLFALLFFSIFSDLMSWFNFSAGNLLHFDYINLGWPLIIIFIYQKILLKVTIYKHHYLSILINLFLSFILLVILLKEYKHYFLQFIIFASHFIVSESLFAIYLCIEYYVYNNVIISPYLILSLQGLIGIIILILEEYIRMILGYKNVFRFIFDFKENIIQNIFSIILYCIVYICYLIIVVKNTPVVMGVIDCLEIIILTLMNYKKKINWITIFIALTFMILLMIFCEMIILNFYEFNKDVKNNIQIRAREKLSYSSSYFSFSESETSSIVENEIIIKF